MVVSLLFNSCEQITLNGPSELMEFPNSCFKRRSLWIKGRLYYEVKFKCQIYHVICWFIILIHNIRKTPYHLFRLGAVTTSYTFKPRHVYMNFWSQKPKNSSPTINVANYYSSCIYKQTKRSLLNVLCNSCYNFLITVCLIFTSLFCCLQGTCRRFLCEGWLHLFKYWWNYPYSYKNSRKCKLQ